VSMVRTVFYSTQESDSRRWNIMSYCCYSHTYDVIYLHDSRLFYSGVTTHCHFLYKICIAHKFKQARVRGAENHITATAIVLLLLLLLLLPLPLPLPLLLLLLTARQDQPIILILVNSGVTTDPAMLGGAAKGGPCATH